MSQGGFISLRVLLLAPERVRGLILLNTQAGTEDPEVVPLYQGMVDSWVADGPTDELAGTTAVRGAHEEPSQARRLVARLPSLIGSTR